MRAFISGDADLKQNYINFQSRPGTQLITRDRRLISLDGVIERCIFVTLKGFNDARSRLAVNCKSSVSISRERASRSIYFEAILKDSCKRERENISSDRNAAMNSSHEYIYTNTRNTIHKSNGPKGNSWHLSACTHLVIFIGEFFFSRLRISTLHARLRRFQEIHEAKLRVTLVKIIYCNL